MKKRKWILAVLALVTVVVITMPNSGLIFCEHEYACNSDCTVKTCNKCGYTATYTSPSHSFKKVSCIRKVCTGCGRSKHGDFHSYTRIPCTSQRVCTVCNYTDQGNAVVYHANRTTDVANCKVTTICLDCNKVVEQYDKHTWISESCEEGNFYCKDCGSTAYPYSSYWHNYNYSFFFCFFGICKKCGHVMFQIPSFRYVAAFVGLLMSIAAIVFIFCNRKRIRVEGGKYIRTATPEAHLKEEEIF